MTIEQYSKSFHEIPEPTAKQLWVRDFKQMATHIRGNKSEELISKRRPNEPLEIQAYRQDNYRAITRGPFNQAVTNLVRTLNHSSVSITFPEDISAFLNDTNFHNKPFLSFFESEITRKMIEMANGFLVWWPTNIGDETQLIEMRPIIVKPQDVVHFEIDEVFTFLSSEKSEVIYNNKPQMIGEVYYVILKEGLFKRVQIGKKTDNQFEYVEHYANPTGMIYPLVLGGDEVSGDVRKSQKVIAEDVQYFTSFFSSAVPFADECLVQFSDNQGTLVSCSFPIREMESIECPVQECTNGKIEGEDCTTCGGSGRVPIHPSPYGAITRPVRQQNITNEISAAPGEDSIKFLHASVDILEHGSNVWKDHYKMTKEALNLLFTDVDQSGLAKEIDREDKVATLDKIGRHLYNYLIKNSIQYIHKFTYPDKDWVPVQIILPSTFVPKTQTQIQEEVKTFREMSVPDSVLAPKMREMMRKTVNGDPLEMRIYDIASIIDPLYLRTLNEKMSMVATDVISSDDMKRSNLYPFVIRDYANVNKDFLTLETTKIVEDVKALVDDLVNSEI